jgi:putative transposase
MTNASTPDGASSAPGPAERLAGMLSPEAIDGLLADAEAAGTAIDGPDGLLARMTKAVLERALDVEITDHLGYEAGDPAGNGSGNSRNGHGRKTVHTTAGPVELEVPRDRNGSFTPVIVPKRKRRLGNVEDMIISLYARGMSTRDITAHLAEVYGASVSAATISRVTDVVADEIAAWQNRPVDPVYPILYIDAIRIKVRDAGVVANKAAHLVVGVDLEGRKQVLGVWIQQTEGAKFWSGVLTELRNRGLRDALFVCCDGLTGLPGAVNAVWPAAVVQTCVVHLIRASMRYVSWKDRKAMVHRPHRAGRRAGFQRLQGRVEHPGGRRSRGLGAGLGGVHPVPGLRSGDPQGHLHHEPDRVDQLPAPEGDQGTRLVPHRRGRDEDPLPRVAQHQRPERR